MATAKTKAPETTGEEHKYLRHLIDQKIPVRVRLDDGSEVAGVIEYIDINLVRLTRDGQPNLFIYKDNIRYMSEIGK